MTVRQSTPGRSGPSRLQKPASEQPGNSWRYLYQRLSEKEFQQLCGALLRLANPGVRCYPVGMSDGGKDAAVAGDGGAVIYQVKWTSKTERDPVAWLKHAVDGEWSNIERLVAEENATTYYLMTSVAGTSVPKTGTMDKLDREMEVFSKRLGIHMIPFWQADIDSMVDNAPDATKWSYANMLAGHDLIRYLIYGSQVEGRAAEMRTTLLKVMATQWNDDAKIKFSQVEMDHINIVDLYVDVAEEQESPPLNARALAPRHNVGSHGTVDYLSETDVPLTLIRGEPGQGKSTVTQYLCQVHRAAILPEEDVLRGRPPEHTARQPKLTFRVDLRDYATWLSGRDPYGEDDQSVKAQRRRGAAASVDGFLADYCAFYSGGRGVSVEQIQDVLDRYPVLIVFDGLDEVADRTARQTVVTEIDRLAHRLGAIGQRQFQIVVTTRPNATGLPEPSADIFESIRLQPFSPKLRQTYLRKWAAANGLEPRKRRLLARLFLGNAAEDHIAQLAVNPMQLTILLYLVNTLGEAIPTARTPLYTAYLQTLLSREIDNHQIAHDHIPYVQETTAYLGWRMHSGVETNSNAGRMNIKHIKRAMLVYLDEVEGPTELVDTLFSAVSDRFWALSSKAEETFEFSVQPVREYFAASFLAKYASAEGHAALKQDVLRELMDSAYWLNTARFYAGFADHNELAGLVYGLRDGLEAGLHPLQSRVTCWSLLADGIFSANRRVQRDAAQLLSDNLSVRLLARGNHDGVNFERLDANRGGDELATAFITAIEKNPAHALTIERAALLQRLGVERERASAWWSPRMQAALGTEDEATWLTIGAATGLVHLTATAADYLALSSTQARRAALAIGANPTFGKHQSTTLLRAVLDGQVTDVPAASTSEAGDLLRAVRPQHFMSLAKDSVDSPVFTIATGHYAETAADRRNRSSVFARLNRLDTRYQKVQRAATFRRGETGTTAPWQNTAREIAAIHEPCWLAAEIAVLGAATQNTRTGGNISQNGAAGGPAIDYGVFVHQVRAARSNTGWWSAQHDIYPDELSRRTWALALVAVADEAVVRTNLPALNRHLRELDADTFRTTADSSSRLGISGIGRRLSPAILADITDYSARTLALICHHTARLSDLDPLTPLPLASLIEMLDADSAQWPALRALTARMLAAPSAELLDGLRAAGPLSVVDVPTNTAGLDTPFTTAILNSPADFPIAWVVAAERWHSQSTKQRPMSSIAAQRSWVPELSN